MAVGEQALGDDALGILAADDLRVALGGVDAADLHGVHLDARALLQIHDGLGIHNVFAVAVSLAVMLLGVVDMGIFADVEGVYAVMAALVAAGVVDAAAGDDVHVAVLADVEVVVDHLGKAGLADDDGDVALLALCAGLDADDDAALALRLGDDLNMLGGLAGLAAAVLTDVERADGLAREVGDLFQKAGVDIGQHSLVSPFSAVQHGAGAECIGHDEGEDLLGRAAVPDLAAADHDDLVGELNDALLMGNDDHARRVLTVELLKGLGQTGEAPQVDAGLGLVEDHQRGMTREQRRDLDALDLAAREGDVHFAVEIVVRA